MIYVGPGFDPHATTCWRCRPARPGRVVMWRLGDEINATYRTPAEVFDEPRHSPSTATLRGGEVWCPECDPLKERRWRMDGADSGPYLCDQCLRESGYALGAEDDPEKRGRPKNGTTMPDAIASYVLDIAPDIEISHIKTALKQRGSSHTMARTEVARIVAHLFAPPINANARAVADYFGTSPEFIYRLKREQEFVDKKTDNEGIGNVPSEDAGTVAFSPSRSARSSLPSPLTPARISDGKHTTTERK